MHGCIILQRQIVGSVKYLKNNVISVYISVISRKALSQLQISVCCVKFTPIHPSGYFPLDLQHTALYCQERGLIV